MKVHDVMAKNVEFCWPDTNLAAASAQMWEKDCGALPVIVGGGIVVGMITDRDIAMAGGMKDRALSEIHARDVMSHALYSCRPDDDVHTALKLMRKDRVRRLPVTDEQGVLEGILSINDIVLAAAHPNGKHAPAIDYDDVVSTFKAICEHRHSQQRTRPLARGATA